jgi:DNA-directed RNA polymerase II subunit RPB2
MTTNEFNLFGEYLLEKGVASHQIESYDYLSNTYLQRIFDEIPTIVLNPKKNQTYKVEFGQVYVDTPSIVEDDRTTSLLYPNQARLRDLTYESSIRVDITETLDEEGEDSIVTHHSKALIARIPMMIGSSKCNLYNLQNEEKQRKGECMNDPGGYFIVKGKERVLISQERINYNHIYVFEQKSSSKYYLQADIRSMSEETGHSVAFHAKINKQGNQIMFSLPYISQDVQAGVVFKAMGFTKEDVSRVLDTAHGAINKIILKDMDMYETQEQALEVIGNSSMHVITDDKKPEYAKQVITNEILPHMGILTSSERLFFLCHMLKRLIDTHIGIRPADDRDCVSLKRIETSGILVGDLFRMLLKRFVESAKKYLVKRPSIMVVLGTMNSITNGIRYCFSTGNWGVQKNTYIRAGVSQVLSRLTYSSMISHLRRLVIPIGKEGKNTKIRQIHPSQIGYICCLESPEGQQVGIVKNLAMLTRITTKVPTTVVRDIVSICKDILPIDSSVNISRTKIFINGVLIGWTKNEQNVITFLNELKCSGALHHDVSFIHDNIDKEISIFSDEGRLSRPMLTVNNNGELNNYKDDMNWDDLMQKNIVRYVDSNEAEHSVIAMYKSELSPNHTYCELHPSLTLLGSISISIPFAPNNQSPRNVYQCGMFKQALGIYCTNFHDRFDTVGHVLNYPQRPLVSTQQSKMLKYDDMAYGTNAIVAVMCYTGFSQEDAVIVNKSAVDRGLFVSTCFKTIVCEEKHRSQTVFETVEVPPPQIRSKSLNYTKLDHDGIVSEGTPIVKGDVIVGKTLTKLFKDDDKEQTDCSLSIKSGEEGIVDKVAITINSDGNRIIKIKIRSVRVPEMGDKLALRQAQKGVIGLMLNQEDMPFTDEGICPDVLLNPNALPSRMTIAQLLESVLGKKCCFDGTYGDGTSFLESNYDRSEQIAEELKKYGYNGHGYETLYNGMTGMPIRAKIFIGPSYYQRLKHMVKDKIHSRSQGNVTVLSRQPVDGRSKDGGLRSGEMEAWCMVSHGISSFLRERMFDMSDKYEVTVCTKCGVFGCSSKACHSCKSESISMVDIPYACKLLLQELNAMGIKTSLKTKN